MQSSLFECTFVNMSACKFCYQELERGEGITVGLPGFHHPDPIIIICSSKVCFEKAQMAVTDELRNLKRYPLVVDDKTLITVQRTNGTMEHDWHIGMNVTLIELQTGEKEWGLQTWKEHMVKCIRLVDFVRWNPDVHLQFLSVPYLEVPASITSLLH